MYHCFALFPFICVAALLGPTVQVVRARVTSLDSLGRPRCSLKAGKGAPGAEAAAPANGAAAHGRALQVGVDGCVYAVFWRDNKSELLSWIYVSLSSLFLHWCKHRIRVMTGMSFSLSFDICHGSWSCQPVLAWFVKVNIQSCLECAASVGNNFIVWGMLPMLTGGRCGGLSSGEGCGGGRRSCYSGDTAARGCTTVGHPFSTRRTRYGTGAASFGMRVSSSLFTYVSLLRKWMSVLPLVRLNDEGSRD
eukprot:1037664-Pelagomonas_calceolata.AAC.4